jgi:hypothetical protein
MAVMGLFFNLRNKSFDKTFKIGSKYSTSSVEDMAQRNVSLIASYV